MYSRGGTKAGMRRRFAPLLCIATVAPVLTGCGLTIPTDPNGSFERIENGEMRVGMAGEPGLAALEDGHATGSLVTLVEGFAEQNTADIDWVAGSEESLVEGLEQGDIDLAIGGMTSDTAWVDRAGVTRGYPGVPGADGRELVMLVPLGENRLLTELEGYLDREVGA